MVNVLKMDLYRMFTSKQFKVSFLLVTLVSLASKPINKVITQAVASFVKKASESTSDSAAAESAAQAVQSLEIYTRPVSLSSLFATPFGYSVLIAIALISVVGFAYADIANGYNKNYVGQLPKRSDSIVSKFLAIGVHNIAVFIGALIGSIVGEVMVRGVFVDDALPQAVGTFFLKLLLLQALSTILLFFTAGVRLKTFASVAGVLLGTGLLGLAYLGLNSAIKNVFGLENLNISEYAPDQLLTTDGNIAAFNALIVSCIIIAVFLPLTIKIFDTKDVK